SVLRLQSLRLPESLAALREPAGLMQGVGNPGEAGHSPGGRILASLGQLYAPIPILHGLLHFAESERQLTEIAGNGGRVLLLLWKGFPLLQAELQWDYGLPQA